MRMKKKTVRVLAFVMAAVMAFSLAGCGKKNKKEPKGAGADRSSQPGAAAAVIDKDHIYREEKIRFEEKIPVGELIMIDGRIHTAGTSYDMDYRYPLFVISSFNEEGKDIQKTVYRLPDQSDISSTCYGQDGSLYGILNCYTYRDEEEPAESGVMEVSENAGEEEAVTDPESETEEEGNVYDGPVADLPVELPEPDGNEESIRWLIKFSSDGSVEYAKELKLESDNEDGGYLWVDSICVSGDTAALNCYGSIALCDAGTGELKKTVKYSDNNGVDRLIPLKDGRIVAGGYSYDEVKQEGGFRYNVLDTQGGKLGEEIELPFTGWSYRSYPGKNSEFMLVNDTGIYTADIGSEPVLLMDFLSSDIAEANYGSFVMISPEKILACGYDEEDYTEELRRFTKVDPASVKDRIPLTMAAYYLSWRTRQNIVSFNKTNDTYRIQVTDYSKYDTESDYSGGITRFNADLASGKIPDMLEMNSNVPFATYASKGMFEDLGPYLASDPELSKNKYLTNIFDAFGMEGKMYRIVPSFTVQTVAGAAENFGREPGLTAEQIEAVMSRKGNDYRHLLGYTSRESAFYMFLIWGGSNFIDWQNMTCQYRSKEFTDLLELIRKFPKELAEEDYNEDYDSMYRNGKALLATQYLSSYSDYNYLKKGQFGCDVTLLGYPNGGKKDYSGSIVNTGRAYAMSASSPYKEGVWQFLRTMFTKEYQDKIGDLEGGFPVLETSLSAMAEQAQKKPTYKDEKGVETEYDMTWYVNGQEITIDPMSKEEAAFFTDYLKSLTRAFTYDEKVMEILQEDTAAFFEGQKSAEQVADIIQSRISMYLNEIG